MAREKVTIWKSLVAGAGAAVTAAIPYSSDGINLQEALIIAGAFLATQQATYWTPRTKIEPDVQADGDVNERALRRFQR